MRGLAASDKSLVVRNIVFGVEDGLVSTVGFLAGISAASLSKQYILVTGVILILVEAFSMAIGSLLSEHTAEEYAEHKEVSMKRPFYASAVMFVSYVMAGLIPLFPYIILEPGLGQVWSVAISIIAIAALGWANARLFGLNIAKKIIEMTVLGGLAILVGVGIGRLLR
jgi:VIT1/CCC1 family predicted Fe2+/Mn2+ transporter